MKKIFTLIFILLLSACNSDEGPVFRIDSTGNIDVPNMKSTFDRFVELAGEYNVIVPQNNLILRYVEEENINTNNSRSYREGDQIRVDIDYNFMKMIRNQTFGNIIFYQNLAHALLDREFEDCGVMWKIENLDDLNRDYPSIHPYLANLFDPAEPCP